MALISSRTTAPPDILLPCSLLKASKASDGCATVVAACVLSTRHNLRVLVLSNRFCVRTLDLTWENIGKKDQAPLRPILKVRDQLVSTV